ncbi:MAG: hypothetical protein R2867_13290 [Caldilineaceae bacterium]
MTITLSFGNLGIVTATKVPNPRYYPQRDRHPFFQRYQLSLKWLNPDR